MGEMRGGKMAVRRGNPGSLKPLLGAALGGSLGVGEKRRMRALGRSESTPLERSALCWEGDEVGQGPWFTVSDGFRAFSGAHGVSQWGTVLTLSLCCCRWPAGTEDTPVKRRIEKDEGHSEIVAHLLHRAGARALRHGRRHAQGCPCCHHGECRSTGGGNGVKSFVLGTWAGGLTVGSVSIPRPLRAGFSGPRGP